MSRNNLELRDGDERVWLNYWDLSEGKDQIIEIRDGKAYLTKWEFKDENDWVGREIYKEVNLIEFLVTLAKEIG